MLNSNGTLRWSTGLGHSDKAYLTQVDPRLSGMQVYLVAEARKDDGRGVSLYDAKTGSFLWGIGQNTLHVGDGMVADIDPNSPGLECFASEDPKGGSSDKYLLTADGKKMDVPMNEIPDCRNWLWWDADLTRETVSYGSVIQEEGRRRRFSQNIVKWRGEKLTEGIEGEIQMIVDFNGDWREELIATLPGEIRVYQTAIPAKDRRITLLQDPVYRNYILHRSMGYPQSPVPGYYLGN
jgi:rhamnogalacturonan endolyase